MKTLLVTYINGYERFALHAYCKPQLFLEDLESSSKLTSHSLNTSQRFHVFIITQHHRGRPPLTDMWVFGLVDTSTSPALGYMEIVPRRDAATLLPIINNHVAPGTIVHSDEWRAYNQVATLPNVSSHATVNHSMTFVAPTTGTHTQHIESYWNRAKVKLKRMRGCHTNQIP